MIYSFFGLKNQEWRAKTSTNTPLIIYPFLVKPLLGNFYPLLVKPVLGKSFGIDV
jgi:hypothetical protein